MKKYIKIISKVLMCTMIMLMLGCVGNVAFTNTVSAEEVNSTVEPDTGQDTDTDIGQDTDTSQDADSEQNVDSDQNTDTVTDIDMHDLKIVGPDMVFAFEKEVTFTLGAKEGSKGSELIKQYKQDYRGYYYYDDFNDLGYSYSYKWSSTNEKVAKLVEILNFDRYSYDCVRPMYRLLERPHIFTIQPGTTTIQCEIRDREGNTVTLNKKVKILSGGPLKKLQIGKHTLKKKQRLAQSTILYTNDHSKNAKIKATPKAGWKIKSISVTNRNGKYKNITKKKSFSLKSDRDMVVRFQLEHIKTGTSYSYYVNIRRYVEHKIKLGKLKKGCAVVYRLTSRPIPLPPTTIVIKYKKNSKANDRESFKSAKDLVRKLKKYEGYSDETIRLKNGVLIYKEASGLKKLFYCKSKKETKNTIKQLED